MGKDEGNNNKKHPLDFCTKLLPIRYLNHQQTWVFPLKQKSLTQSGKQIKGRNKETEGRC